jgi:outer membrane lipoprotein-sorting protein
VIQSQPRSGQPSANNDPEAEKYLKLVNTKLQTLKGYKLNFTTEIIDADQKKQTYQGSYAGSGDRFILDLPDTKTINDGKTQWTINKGEMEINISKYSKPKQSKAEIPIDIIKNYSRLFKYRVKEPLHSQQIVLELVPLNKNSNFFKVDLTLDVKKHHILGAKLYDKGGHRISFKFADMHEFKTIAADAFILLEKDYPGYEILDTR